MTNAIVFHAQLLGTPFWNNGFPVLVLGLIIRLAFTTAVARQLALPQAQATDKQLKTSFADARHEPRRNC
jgi:hypothetical protein